MRKNKYNVPIKTISILGVRNLFLKKGRLVLTIVLFSLTLILVGIGYGAFSFDINSSTYAILEETGEEDVGIRKFSKTNGTSEKVLFSTEEMDYLEEKYASLDYIPIYGESIETFQMHELGSPKSSNDNLIGISGYTVLTEEVMEKRGMEVVAGHLPTGLNEVALTTSIFEAFRRRGYINNTQLETISSYFDILGKSIRDNNSTHQYNMNLVIVGVVDTSIRMDYGENNSFVSNYAYDSWEADVYYRRDSYHFSNIISRELADYAFCEKGDYAKYKFYFEDNFTSLLGINSTRVTELSSNVINNINVTRILNGDFSAGEIYLRKDLLVSALTLPFEEFSDEKLEQAIASEKLNIFANIYDFKGGEYLQENAIEYKIAGYWEVENSGDLTDLGIMFFKDDFLFEEQPTGNLVKGAYYLIDNEQDFEVLSDLLKDNDFSIVSIFSEDFEFVSIYTFFFKNIGFYGALAFSIFAILMMFNYIYACIYSQKRELGLLRAMGARKTTIYLIYLMESLLVGLISFFIATVGVTLFSKLFTVQGIVHNIHFSPVTLSMEQISIIFGGGVCISIVGSFFPVLLISRKTPADTLK